MAKTIQAAVLSIALMLPGASAFARTHHHYRHRAHYASSRSVRAYTYHPHHYSQTRGAVVGGVAGALIGRGWRSAVVGAAVGDAVPGGFFV